jgi:hypothetical protein
MGAYELRPPNAPNRLTAIDWAYESDPDTAILTGAGIPAGVPEPGTMLLSLLAAGSVGVMARKRRKTTPQSDLVA